MTTERPILKTAYVEHALAHGGKIEIKMRAGEYNCEMTWPNIAGQVSAMGKTLDQAIRRLDTALMDDWASEPSNG